MRRVYEVEVEAIVKVTVRVEEDIDDNPEGGWTRDMRILTSNAEITNQINAEIEYELNNTIPA